MKWQILLFTFFMIIGASPINFIYAQGGKASLTDKLPKHLPLSIKFEKADTEDLLATINVKVTNKSNKPIYFLLVDLMPTDITDNKGVNFSFRLTYGDMKFYTPTEYAQPADKPLLPGESCVLSVDSKILAGWGQRLEKDKKLKPKQFEFNFRFLSFGDGSGYWATSGQSFSDRWKKGQNGELIKKSLMNESEVKQNKIAVKKQSNSSAFLFASSPVKNQNPSQTCRQKASSLPSFFVNAKFTVESFTNSESNPLKTGVAMTPCGCPDEAGCGFYKNWRQGCCQAGDANETIPYYEVASCNDYADGFCSIPVRTAEPYYCAGSSGTDNGCYGFYLDYCSAPGPPPPPPSGGGAGSGGGGYYGGGGCTSYYWVTYVSYDGGKTWQEDSMSEPAYAGCW